MLSASVAGDTQFITGARSNEGGSGMYIGGGLLVLILVIILLILIF